MKKELIQEIGEKTEFILRCRARGEKSEIRLRKAFKQEFPETGPKDFNAAQAEANKMIREYFQDNLEELFSEITMHLWELYSKNHKLQDYRECRTILKQISDLAEAVNLKKPTEETQSNNTPSIMHLARK